MLLPFYPVAQNADNFWISPAIDEDLAHDLSRNRAIRVLRPATTQPLGAADALAAARDAKAQRLISGSYQVVDDQLRVTAEVTDVNQPQPVGQIKASGRIRDLFQIEDSLAMQLWHILPQSDDQALANEIQVSSPEDYTQPAPPPQAYYEAPQTQVAPAPVYDTSPGYDYAPYGAEYPYAYGYPYDNYGFGLGFPLFYGGYGGYGYGGGNRGGGGYHGHYFGGGGGGYSGAIGRGVSPAFGGGGGVAHFGGGGGGHAVGGGGHR
jgi:TolB-like protein